MTTKFKIGDRVKYVSGKWADSKSNPLWGGEYGKIIGTIEGVWGKDCDVKWDNGECNG